MALVISFGSDVLGVIGRVFQEVLFIYRYRYEFLSLLLLLSFKILMREYRDTMGRAVIG